MSKSIFVVGPHRSGTTWIANILCQHSKIAGVQADEHFGIHESAFFSSVENYFGDLRNDNNFIIFVESFGSSDYFRLTGLNKDFLYNNRPKTYAGAFRLIMNAFAKKRRAKYWIEKTPAHTLYLNKIVKYFPNAKFIGITRNVIDVLKSAVRRQTFKGNFKRKLFILKRTWRYFKYLKHLYHFKSRTHNKKRIIIIKYEDLRKNLKKTLIKICKFLELNFEPNLLKQSYEPNTSFTYFNNEKERESTLSKSELFLIKILAIVFNMVPFIIYRAFIYLQLNLRKKKLPIWYWKIFKKEKLKFS